MAFPWEVFSSRESAEQDIYPIKHQRRRRELNWVIQSFNPNRVSSLDGKAEEQSASPSLSFRVCQNEIEHNSGPNPIICEKDICGAQKMRRERRLLTAGPILLARHRVQSKRPIYEGSAVRGKSNLRLLR